MWARVVVEKVHIQTLTYTFSHHLLIYYIKRKKQIKTNMLKVVVYFEHLALNRRLLIDSDIKVLFYYSFVVFHYNYG